MPLSYDDLFQIFSRIHACPELGMQETKTTLLIRDTLASHDITLLPLPLATGVVASIGHGKGPVIGLRCDMDALPIEEATDLPYRSQVPGIMHACGHDFHTTVMLGVALALKEEEDSLPGQVRIVFQPAEELATGGYALSRTGIVDDCTMFLGIHTYPGFTNGTLGIKEGPVMAAVDRFRVTLRGRGTHAAHPHKGIDPVPALATLVTSLQTLASRLTDPFAPVLCSITHMEAGNTWNVIPESGMLEGTIRTMTPQVRAEVESHFRRIVEDTSHAFRVEPVIEWHAGPPAVINDPALCALARTVADSLGLQTALQEDTLGGEDFSEFLTYPRLRPGIFVRIGTGGDYPQHHPRFTVDPQALPGAVAFFTQMAKACMQKA